MFRKKNKVLIYKDLQTKNYWMGMNNKCKCSQNSVVKNVGIRRLKRCQQTIANGSMNAESARHLWNQKKVIVVFSVHMER